MADLLNFVGVRVLDSNAAPGAGYVARFYRSGTTTPVTVYTTSGLGTPHGTFVTADAEGKFAAVWTDGAVDVKCVIETDTGAVVQTIDPVFATSSSASGASEITFTPTVDLPFTNVQAAIEGAAASAASGFATYGIGITGNATLAADIDATNIGAGVYRFDNTTAGTFPTGVAAADTGLIETWRQAAGTAMMMLYHATSDRVFHRRMASSSWGAWQRVLVGPANFSLDHIVTSTDTLFSNDNDTSLPASAAVIDAIGSYLIVADEKTSGTGGGSSTTGSWVTRTLNTVRTNTISGASLGSNQITLPAGTYRINASAPGLRIANFSTRLRNITDSTDTLIGTSEQSEQSGAIVQSRSHIVGTFTIAGTKAFEIQMQCGFAFGTVGYGNPAGFGTEVYTIAEIQRIA